jgi:hypothetical protein
LTFTVQTGSGYVVGTPSSASASIADNDVAAGPSLSIAALTTITEGNNSFANVTITVTRSGSTSGTTTVNWATSPGTASAGIDYTTASGTLTFSAGQTTATITVRVSGDRTAEPDEDFFVTLSGASGGTIANGTGRVLIVDNDGAMLATALPDQTSPVEPLALADAEAVLDEAIRRWVAAGVAPTALRDVRLVITDLPDRKLADTMGTTIRLDVDAAGWGWRVAAASSSEAAGMDLLTVLLHELGHVLGLDHTDDGLMAGILAPRETRTAPARRSQAHHAVRHVRQPAFRSVSPRRAVGRSGRAAAARCGAVVAWRVDQVSA